MGSEDDSKTLLMTELVEIKAVPPAIAGNFVGNA
jgi:hypothetical protein